MLRAGIVLVLALPLPVLAQDAAMDAGTHRAEDAEFAYVMVMQFNGCEMAEADLIGQMQDAGVDEAGYAAVAETLVARGDAVVTEAADGTKRVSMPETACSPVEMGEVEVTTDPQSEDEQKARYRQDVFTGILGANDCTMTKAEIAAEMPKYGLDLVHEDLTETLVANGSATLTDEADGGQRVTLGPDVCTPGAPVPMLPVKAESVAKLTDYMRANACAMDIAKMEAVEAELGFEPAESSNVFMVMELRGDAKMDMENGQIRLISKDCP